MIKQKIYEIAGYKAFKAHCKTEALRYLFEGFKKDSSSERDESAESGIVYLLEDISNEMRTVYQMLDVTEAKDLGVDIEDPNRYVKGYPVSGLEEIRGLIKKEAFHS